jgi:hypothetical protein
MYCKGFGKRRYQRPKFSYRADNTTENVIPQPVSRPRFEASNSLVEIQGITATLTSWGGHTAVSIEQVILAVDLYVCVRIAASVGTTVFLTELSHEFPHSLQTNTRIEPPINHRSFLPNSNTFQSS